MKVITTPAEERFVAEATKEYYRAATAIDAFQQAVIRILRDVTDEFDSQLIRLGLPGFADALERKSLAPDPLMHRKIAKAHLEASFCLQWLANDPELKGKRLCVYWWIWFKDRDTREALAVHIKAATRKPFEWEPGGEGTSCISLYFPLEQSARIKEQARKCTREFVRVLNGCRRLIKESAKG